MTDVESSLHTASSEQNRTKPNRTMFQLLYLLLLAITFSHFTAGIKLWNSKTPRSNTIWRGNWNLDSTTYRGQESVSAEPNPDGSTYKVSAISLSQGSYGLTDLFSGSEFYSAPLEPRECLTLVYKVWFEDNFDFAYGGKLPGLYGGGVNCTAGGDPGKDCFTSRFIWRTGGGGSFQFQTGTWYTIQQTVRLNTPGQADGYVRIAVGGVGKVYDVSNVVIRESPDVKVDGILFSNYFGGTSSCSGSPVDTHAYFRYFVLKDNFC
ncbi:uncharacterized protein LOC124292468 [Haliotis rubra]|uniref:uncharacterized protein LOC124292468 n=1 Tax=Haliotis rubra TaxID=36100 RepID=UPI001EE5C13C|nr:uncharacterized protein LOC124292468 [Haliotis rubra]